MASAEYQGCPPGVVRGSAAHPSTASALNHTVRLPRRHRLASYAGQFVTLRVCLGMWWRRSWFSLKGKVGVRGQRKGGVLPHPALSTNRPANPCNTATLAPGPARVQPAAGANRPEGTPMDRRTLLLG